MSARGESHENNRSSCGTDLGWGQIYDLPASRPQGECREEIDVELSVGDVFMEVLHEYPDLTVHLTLYNASIAQGKPRKLEHNDIRWITPDEIPDYDFCPADVEILAAIIQNGKEEK